MTYSHHPASGKQVREAADFDKSSFAARTDALKYVPLLRRSKLSSRIVVSLPKDFWTRKLALLQMTTYSCTRSLNSYLVALGSNRGSVQGSVEVYYGEP